MQIRRAADTLILRDSPGCFWLLGAIFLVPGLLLLAGGVGVVPFDEGGMRGGKAIAALAGLGSMVAGLWIIITSRYTVSEFDSRRRQLRIHRRSLITNEVEHYSFDDIAAVRVIEGKDSEGDPIYKCHLAMRDASEVPILPLWVHHKEGLEEAATAMREVLNLMS